MTSQPGAILPCPFCGKPAEITAGNIGPNENYEWVSCADEECAGFIVVTKREKWNTREREVTETEIIDLMRSQPDNVGYAIDATWAAKELLRLFHITRHAPKGEAT